MVRLNLSNVFNIARLYIDRLALRTSGGSQEVGLFESRDTYINAGGGCLMDENGSLNIFKGYSTTNNL